MSAFFFFFVLSTPVSAIPLSSIDFFTELPSTLQINDHEKVLDVGQVEDKQYLHGQMIDSIMSVFGNHFEYSNDDLKIIPLEAPARFAYNAFAHAGRAVRWNREVVREAMLRKLEDKNEAESRRLLPVSTSLIRVCGMRLIELFDEEGYSSYLLHPVDDNRDLVQSDLLHPVDDNRDLVHAVDDNRHRNRFDFDSSSQSPTLGNPKRKHSLAPPLDWGPPPLVTRRTFMWDIWICRGTFVVGRTTDVWGYIFRSVSVLNTRRLPINSAPIIAFHTAFRADREALERRLEEEYARFTSLTPSLKSVSTTLVSGECPLCLEQIEEIRHRHFHTSSARVAVRNCGHWMCENCDAKLSKYGRCPVCRKIGNEKRSLLERRSIMQCCGCTFPTELCSEIGVVNDCLESSGFEDLRWAILRRKCSESEKENSLLSSLNPSQEKLSEKFTALQEGLSKEDWSLLFGVIKPICLSESTKFIRRSSGFLRRSHSNADEFEENSGDDDETESLPESFVEYDSNEMDWHETQWRDDQEDGVGRR